MKNNRRNNKRKAFTIVELVIVIAVIAILAGVMIPTFGNVVQTAKDSRAMQEARQAYIDHLTENNGETVEKALYKANDGRWVALENGEAVGVYEEEDLEEFARSWGFNLDAGFASSPVGTFCPNGNVVNGGGEEIEGTPTTPVPDPLEIWNADINHIVFYGQSLSTGSDAPYYADDQVENVYVLGDIANSQGNQLKLLTETTINTQHPVISTGNVLAQMLAANGYTTNLVLGSYGKGGQSIAQLMSEARREEIQAEKEYRDDCESQNAYTVFTSSVDALATYAGSNEKSVKCPVIVFLQGERDYLTDTEGNFHAYAAGADKETYKLYMSRLKEDMQQKVMDAYGQDEAPIFMIYQVSGAFVKKDSQINMAQIEFAQENADVFLVQTPYFTSQYGNGHLSQNGYRWLGEYIAKYAYAAMVNGENPSPMLYDSIECVDDNTVRITVTYAEDGLSIDTYTVENASNDNNLYGFNLIVNGNVMKPTNVTVSGNEIILTLDGANLSSADSITVQYAGKNANGTGNIRDNCTDLGYYEYLDDSADKGISGDKSISHSSLDAEGNSIIGKNYPMYNWLASFSCVLKESTDLGEDDVEGTIRIGELTPFETGRGYIDRNGQFVEGNQYIEKYNVIPGTTCYFSGTVRGSAGVAMASFYDADGNFLGNNGIISTGTETVYTNHEFTVPDGAAYMICCAYKNDIVVTGAYIDTDILTGELTPIETGRGYIDRDGQFVEGSQYTKKYYVIPGTTCYFSGTVRGSAGVAMASFYDADGNFLGNNGIISTGTETVYTDHEFVIPDGAAYMICCAYKDDIVVTGAYVEKVILTGKLTPFEVGRGYIVQSGELKERNQYMEKYYVIPGKTYSFSGTMRGSAGVVMASFYDANDNFLGNNGIVSTSTEAIYTNHEFTVPDSAVYMICCAYKDDIVVVGDYYAE